MQNYLHIGGDKGGLSFPVPDDTETVTWPIIITGKEMVCESARRSPVVRRIATANTKAGRRVACDVRLSLSTVSLDFLSPSAAHVTPRAAYCAHHALKGSPRRWFRGLIESDATL